jgi:CRP-like cAMP-binding protein
MDTSIFFNYPTLPASGEAGAPAPAQEEGFLAHATEAEWDAILGATETLRFQPGDAVVRAGERDRSFYLLLDGRLETPAGVEIVAPAAVGVAAFFDGGPRTIALKARTHGELARMSWDAYEALAARDPRLGRTILVELGRSLAARLHATAASLPGWTG